MASTDTVNLTAPGDPVIVCALYRFCDLAGFAELRRPLAKLCCGRGVKGTLLLAPEGINGTIAGDGAAIEAVLTHLRAIPALAGLKAKFATAESLPFKRMKVRLKREIVTMGVAGIDPRHSAGTYVAASDWNALIAAPDVVVVDTRNDYEVAIGTFAGALDPKTRSFSEFPAWVRANLDPVRTPRVAMFCTGGIRCEKATALLRDLGFPEVYHLEGGILSYLEAIPATDSLWRGDCFVFDERVTVGTGLAPGGYQLCSICRLPFVSGTGAGGYAERPCAACEATASPERKAAAAERQRQIALARGRGQVHVGMADLAASNDGAARYVEAREEDD
ncbi:MAG: rhodanese-related sulfurtransferase [Hyphomicrobiaceae bacterium]|nr:rhodanese-related sulfurtransferase [Hyphomicrobiaceae bacterium]